MDTSLWLLPTLLLLIALAAPRYGVDSREGSLWNRRYGPPDPPPPMASRRKSTPGADLAAVARLVRRTVRDRRAAATSTARGPSSGSA